MESNTVLLLEGWESKSKFRPCVCSPDAELVSINVESKLIQGYCSKGPPGAGEVNFKLDQVTCVSQADCLPISVTHC